MKKQIIVIFLLAGLLSANPKVAIIVDDLGPDLMTYSKIFKIKYPLTLSIMPAMTKTKWVVKNIPTSNFEILIHFPWEAISKKVDNYPIRISSGMKTTKIKKMIKSAVLENPRAVGINNHMGSLISTNKDILDIFMADIKGRDLFFVDSMTVRGSKAALIARKKSIKTISNSFFLDHQNKEKSFRKSFRLMVRKAVKNGSTVAICHANRSVSVRLLPELMRIYSKDVDFVFVSTLVK